MATKNTFKNFTPNPNQDVNTPKYDRATGLLTDFGRYSGAAQVNPLSNANLIDIGTLSGSNQPLVMPPLPATMGADGLGTFIEQTTQTQSDKLAETSQTKADKSSLDYLTALTASAGIPESIDYRAQDAAKKEVDRLNASIMAEGKANRDRINRIKENPTGQNLSSMNDEITRENDKSVNRQADFAILKYVADNDYQGAREIADRSLSLKLEASKIKLEGLKYMADTDAAKADKAFSVALAEKIKTEQRVYDEKVKTETQISDIRKGIAQYAGANASALLSELSKIDTTQKGAVDKAIAIGGKYLEDPLDRQLKQAQINSANRANQPDAGGGKIVNVNGKDYWQSANGTLTTPNVPTTINPATGTLDPKAQLANIIQSNGLKTDDKLKLTGSVVSVVQSFAQNNVSGKFEGLGFGQILPTRFAGQKGQQNRTDLSALTGTVESWMTGASVSEDQQKRIQRDMIPKTGDSDTVIKNKTNALINYMMTYASGSLATQGVDWTPQRIDLYEVVPQEERADQYIDGIVGSALLNTNSSYQQGGYETE